MAKRSGLGASLLVDGYDLSADVMAVDKIGDATALLDFTSIADSGHARQHGLIDGDMSFTHYFDDAAAYEHAVLAAKGSGADRIATYLQGAAIGNMAAALTGKQINYDWTRGADGTLIGKTGFQANAYGLDYCEQLTAGLRTDTGATNGSALDAGAASALGAAAYLHVIEFTGTDATIAVESSSDDGAGDAYAAIAALTFTQVTSGPVAERKATAAGAAVEEYLRVATTTSEGFSSMSFSVVLTRFPAVL